MKVKLLPDTVVNQISAGEVVERPSAVVRELVENSIDAGATDILVELEQGGQTLIRVTDNGCGMDRNDALLALERHATSKITSAEDLHKIGTLGFRGEALPSIASVSRLVLRTRVAEQETGTEISVQGGALGKVAATPATPGTQIEVRALFFNTPARRKFLKGARTEELRVKQWVLGTALAHPQVRLRLQCDGRELLNLPRRESTMERARGIFRGSVVSFQEGDTASVSACGIVGHPASATADLGSFLILVNGRIVTDRVILRAVKEGFSSTLKEREYPLGFIALRVPPEIVDVNVHPQKSEVRFIDSQSIFRFVRGIVGRATLDFKSPVTFFTAPGRAPSIAVSSPEVRSPLALYTSAQVKPSSPPPPFDGGAALAFDERVESAAAEFESERSPFSAESLPVPPALAESSTLQPFRFSDLRYIGQALQCYLFCEWQGALYVVDMHAAHERYNYNLIRNSARSKSSVRQLLLLPERIEIGEEGMESFHANREALLSLGFDIEAEDSRTVLVRGAPGVINGRNIPTIVREIVMLAEGEDSAGRYSETLDKIAARLACHASVRSGDSLTPEEVASLFAALDSAQFSAACPHGRPIAVRFGATEIERWFGRDR